MHLEPWLDPHSGDGEEAPLAEVTHRLEELWWQREPEASPEARTEPRSELISRNRR